MGNHNQHIAYRLKFHWWVPWKLPFSCPVPFIKLNCRLLIQFW